MYGMMPSAKMVKRDSAPPGEHVEHAQDAALLALEQVRQHVRVDARHRDVRADAEHHQRAEQEQQPPLQVAVAPGFARGGKRGGQAPVPYAAFGASAGACAGASTLPPAASIAARAPLVALTPFSVTPRVSLPERMTFAARHVARHDALGLEHGEVDLRRLDALQLREAHLRVEGARRRGEAALGQAPMQRHLAALEADLVVAARARALTLVAAACGLAPAGAAAAADTVARVLLAGRGLECVEAHVAILRCVRGS